MEAATSSAISKWSRGDQINFCITHVYSAWIKKAKKLSIYEGFKADNRLKHFWQVTRGCAYLPLNEPIFERNISKFFDEVLSEMSRSQEMLIELLSNIFTITF